MCQLNFILVKSQHSFVSVYCCYQILLLLQVDILVQFDAIYFDGRPVEDQVEYSLRCGIAYYILACSLKGYFIVAIVIRRVFA